MKIKLRKARLIDMSTIIDYIEKFRLDDENIDYRQFIVAEKDKKIIGFGRIKPYRDCFELGSVGVLETYRDTGVGEAIVKRLIRDSPENDIWITTDIPEYFARFGFKPAKDAHAEIKNKIKNMCQIKKHPYAIIMLLKK